MGKCSAYCDKDVVKMYQCFHCLAMAVIWDADFTFEDYGRIGEGIVHACHCTNCGAQIEYFIPVGEEEGEDAET